MTRKTLTNLECVALAHIWRLGGCTAHQLRQDFAKSTAGRYSGSAGAIYPLAKRLEKSGYLKSVVAKNGEQKKRIYSILAKGKAAVSAWMTQMAPPEIFPDDPIRTRAQYLHLLPKKAQADWRRQALAALDQLDAAITAEYRETSHRLSVDDDVLKSVIDTNQMRRAWVRSLK